MFREINHPGHQKLFTDTATLRSKVLEKAVIYDMNKMIVSNVINK